MPLLDRSGLAQDGARIVAADVLGPALAERGPGDRIGVAAPCDAQAEALAVAAARADLIAIEVPATGDGRVFSLSAALRERGYRGVIRAVGPLIPDQFAFALACGIDQIEIADDQLMRQPVEQWLAARDVISTAYVGANGIFARRGAA